MTITININTANAAFEGENKDLEVGRIVNKIADKITRGERVPEKILDINGNNVGRVEID